MAVARNSFSEISLAVGMALTLFACDGNGEQQNTGTDNKLNEAAGKPDQVAVQKKLNTKDQIAFSKKDLSTRLDVDPATVSLSGATPVQWRSGALGCPEPGMNYTQALVPGIWIMLRVGNTAYHYHAVPGGQPFYCPDDRAEPPVMGSGAD